MMALITGLNLNIKYTVKRMSEEHDDNDVDDADNGGERMKKKMRKRKAIECYYEHF